MKGDTSIWVTRVMMANNRIAGMWRISRHMAHSGAGVLCSCPGFCVPRVMSVVSSAAVAEQPAVIHRIDVMFMAESMNPAKAGPRRKLMPLMPCDAPANQSVVLPERSEMSPTRAVRAAMPGTSPTAPMIPRAMNQAMVSPVVASTVMRAMTEAAEMMSEMMLMRFRPNLSMRLPPMRANAAEGRTMHVVTSPAAAGSPVRWRTSQGQITLAIALPNAERNVAPR